jgi:serine/threonine protein kinase
MAEVNRHANEVDRERILVELARRETEGAGEPLNDVEESTIQSIQAQLETLVIELRQPPPSDDYAEESGCRLAIELAERIALRPEFTAQQTEPDRIGPYQVVAKLGAGGMGSVYKAVHTKLKRVVAIKILPSSRTRDAASIMRFEREMKAIGSLAHRNIVAATDAGEAGGMHYLVMEFVDGIDLSALVRHVGPLATADACEIARQAALGLKEAHDHGIIHRDIKPSNLILAEAGQEIAEPVVKILDFGLARLAPRHGELDELTVSGQIMGTLKYMAPEQCESSRDVDIRADVYSLGATLYRLLSGEPPFSNDRFDSPLTLIAALSNELPVPLATRTSDLPAKLVAIVERMMAKNRHERFATPDEVIEALTPWSQGADLAGLLARARGMEERSPEIQSITADRASASIAAIFGSQLATPRRANPRAVLLAAGALLALVAACLLLWSFDAFDGVLKKREASGESVTHARDVAQWLVSQQAAFGIATAARGFVNLEPGEELPADFTQLITANLDGNKAISNEDLARFDNLPMFTTLGVSWTTIGDEGLRKLRELPLLKHVFLSETKITDAGLKELQRFPKLSVLHLYGTQTTDAGLEHFAGNPMLSELSLVDCDITDVGLKHLTELKRLKKLSLERTGVTAEGVAKLRLALPKCDVGSNIPASEVAAAVEALQKDSNQADEP